MSSDDHLKEGIQVVHRPEEHIVFRPAHLKAALQHQAQPEARHMKTCWACKQLLQGLGAGCGEIEASWVYGIFGLSEGSKSSGQRWPVIGT